MPSPPHAGKTAYIVGAGLAGLSAAVRLCAAGWHIHLLDAAGHAGGRCRSFQDQKLDRLIDNGNHLLLSGNRSARAYLAVIGASDQLLIADDASIPFVDLADGARWTVRPNAGPIGWWIFARNRRVPGSTAMDYLAALKLSRAGTKTVQDLFDPDRPIFRRYWDPLTVAVLNTAPDQAAAKLLWPVMTETILRGAKACRPAIARHGLSQTFVDPALDWLQTRGARIALNTRVRGLTQSGNRVTALSITGADDAQIALRDQDRLVLALPPAPARQLLPGLSVPTAHNAIANLHFKLPAPVHMTPPLLGIIGGTAQWLFARDDVLSVTISAAETVASLSEEALIAAVWGDIQAALGQAALGQAAPVCRVIREKRATFAQTPAALALRPDTAQGPANVALAGDWTATGLPATIEGAIRSGETAARHLNQR